MKIENILGDFYDAWRAQDVALLGTYLPNEFSHMVYVRHERSHDPKGPRRR